MNEQCIMCGKVTANKGRVCTQCIETLDATFEENINNKTKIRHDRKSKQTDREV